MEVIIGHRGWGKTHRLINLSAKTGSHIVCFHADEASRIAKSAKSMGLSIPKPVTFKTILEQRNRGVPATVSYILDNADMFLQQIFGRHELNAISLTDESPITLEELNLLTRKLIKTEGFFKKLKKFLLGK